MSSAESFTVRTRDPGRVARSTREALERVPKADAGVLFLSGEVASQIGQVAEALSGLSRPLLIGTGAGVLTEEGEVEGESAAAGLWWAGGSAEIVTVPSTPSTEVGDALARRIGPRLQGRAKTPIVLARPTSFGPQLVEPLQQLAHASHLFGAGTVGDHDVFVIDAEGRVQSGPAAALVVGGMAPPLLRASPACRLLMPLRRITEARGAMLLSIEGESALDVLGSVGADLVNQPLVFVVLATNRAVDEASGTRPELLVRPVQGVDPVRRGLLVSEDIEAGMSVAFAIRDATAARRDLENVTRQLDRDTRGSLPRFGFYIDCAGRGSSLYQANDVDIRIIRERFMIPLVGLQSAFELVAHAGRPTFQLYTGVLALFTAPS